MDCQWGPLIAHEKSEAWRLKDSRDMLVADYLDRIPSPDLLGIINHVALSMECCLFKQQH